MVIDELELGAFYGGVLEYLPVGVAVFRGGDFRLVFANPAYGEFLRELGRFSDVPGLKLRDYFPEVSEGDLLEMYRRISGSGEMFVNPEMSFRVDGGTVYRKMMALTLPGKVGEMPDLMMVVLDVTEQVKNCRFRG